MITSLDVLAAGAELISGTKGGDFPKVVIDSRQVGPEDLFVALPGERTDGHLFVEQAVQRGAGGILLSQKPQEDLGETLVFQSDDCLATLGQLARVYRRRLDPIVVGVTGSCGKTTTKDFLGSILRVKTQVLTTEGNFNNELGLPLTLLSLERDHKFAVVEMGMRGVGQIRSLCEIAQPQLGIVTNIGESHLELLGSRENIARAKGELIEALPSSGIAVLNGDDDYCRQLARLHSGKTLFFGLSPEHDLWADSIVGSSFRLHWGEESVVATLPTRGRHNILNALAAATAALALGYSPSEIAEGLATAQISDLRLALEKSPDGWLVLNDSYNASPTSTVAALDVLEELAQEQKRRPVAVLADMLELGEGTKELHRQVGAKASSVSLLVTVGELGEEIAQGALSAGMAPESVHAFATLAEAQNFLLANLKGEDLVLVKGSRSMAMDRIAMALIGGGEA